MDDTHAAHKNEEQIKKQVLDAYLEAEKNGFSFINIVSQIRALNLYTDLYKPSEKVCNLLEEYKQWCNNLEEAQDANEKSRVKQLRSLAGNLLEELVFLAFISLEGFESAKSFQSFSAQHDLIISGKVGAWELLLKLLNLNPLHKTFILEAKNRDKKVTDAQFSRMCTIMQLKFEQSCGLGIFVSRMGAAGFPQGKRQRILRDARATQNLFHAKTGKYIIVLDHDDLLTLDQDGALPNLIERKIRDIEEVSGLSDAAFIEQMNSWGEFDVPEHLAQHIPNSTS